MNSHRALMYFSDRERDDMADMSRWFRGMGIAMLVVGGVAVILPHVATLAVQILLGVVLLLVGVLHLAHAIQVHKWRSVTWEVMVAALFLLGGVFFLVNPGGGAVALTFMLGIFFLLHGGFKIPLALGWRPRPGWGWVLTSGIISAALGLIVIGGLPGTALWAIGLILGVDLIFSGATLLALGTQLRNFAT